jgi:hypothetical protein
MVGSIIKISKTNNLTCISGDFMVLFIELITKGNEPYFAGSLIWYIQILDYNKIKPPPNLETIYCFIKQETNNNG